MLGYYTIECMHTLHGIWVELLTASIWILSRSRSFVGSFIYIFYRLFPKSIVSLVNIDKITVCTLAIREPLVCCKNRISVLFLSIVCMYIHTFTVPALMKRFISHRYIIAQFLSNKHKDSPFSAIRAMAVLQALNESCRHEKRKVKFHQMRKYNKRFAVQIKMV